MEWLTKNECFKIVDEMRENIFYREHHNLPINVILVNPQIMTHLKNSIHQYLIDRDSIHQPTIDPNLIITTYLGQEIKIDHKVPGYDIT